MGVYNLLSEKGKSQVASPDKVIKGIKDSVGAAAFDAYMSPDSQVAYWLDQSQNGPYYLKPSTGGR